MNSEFLKLKKADFWKGLIVAGFSSAITTIGTAASMIVDYASLDITVLLKAMVVGLIIGFTGYISKNLFTNSQGEIFKAEK